MNEWNDKGSENSLEDLEPYEQEQVPFNRKADSMKEIYEMIVYILVVVAAVMFFYTFVAQQVQVDGHSMNHTLQDDDRLILEKISYRFNEPKRFDIIVFRPYTSEKKTYYIKRIIGLPGETVQIADGTIYINGIALNESYGFGKIIDSGIAAEPVTLSSEEYFVLGDNRNGSKDSRDSEVGPVKRTAISGRAFTRIWPLNKFEMLKHQ